MVGLWRKELDCVHHEGGCIVLNELVGITLGKAVVEGKRDPCIR